MNKSLYICILESYTAMKINVYILSWLILTNLEQKKPGTKSDSIRLIYVNFRNRQSMVFEVK